MGNILKHTGSNIGGVNPVWFVRIEDISSIVRNEVSLVETVTLKSGKSWSYLYATNGTIMIETDEPDTVAGIKYTYNIKMQVPKDRSSVEATLRQLNDVGLMIKITDKNGVTRYFGEIENPMRKSSKLLKPGEVAGFNGWEVSFFGEFSSPAGYAPTILIAVDPPPEEENPE